MEIKEIAVSCPCCESRLAIDVGTQKVMRWSRKEELDATGKPVVRSEDWDTAFDRVANRQSSATDKFDDALNREKSREKDLDDLFRKAKSKLDEKRDDAL
ncbi:MAG: hypothetical protein ACI8TQ_003804 [Planctomycetota bacterium]|jgi:hypothetical protein